MSSKGRPIIGLRIDDELLRQLKDYCAAHQQTMSDVVRDAITLWLFAHKHKKSQ